MAQICPSKIEWCRGRQYAPALHGASLTDRQDAESRRRAEDDRPPPEAAHTEPPALQAAGRSLSVSAMRSGTPCLTRCPPDACSKNSQPQRLFDVLAAPVRIRPALSWQHAAASGQSDRCTSWPSSPSCRRGLLPHICTRLPSFVARVARRDQLAHDDGPSPWGPSIFLSGVARGGCIGTTLTIARST